MPETDVILFADDHASSPLLKWLDGLPETVQVKCLDRVQRLRAWGHELRRPHSAPLRDGIHELRVRSGRVQYRMLYFFHEHRAVLSHGCTKERTVPAADVERAIANRKKFMTNPERRTMRSE